MEYREIIDKHDGSNINWNNIEIKNNTDYGYIVKVVSNTKIEINILVNKKDKLVNKIINPTFVLYLHRNMKEIVIEKEWNKHPELISFDKHFKTTLSLGFSGASKSKASINYINI